MVDRRGFLSVLGGASLAWPSRVERLARSLEVGGTQDDEAFWAIVRRQFDIPDDRIYLNNGTLGPSPRVVVDAVVEHTRRVARTYPPGIAVCKAMSFSTSSANCSTSSPNSFSASSNSSSISSVSRRPSTS